MKVSARDIAGMALGAGFPPNAVETAVAVALAESGGDSENRGDVGIQTATWGPSIGLWQIRSLKAETGKGTPRDANRLTDPFFNAQSAHSIWAAAGGTFAKDWSAYRSRAYLLYLPAAKLGVSSNGGTVRTSSPTHDIGNPLIPDALENAGQAVGQIGDLAKFPAAVVAWISDRNNILRVAKVGVGAGLVLIGLYVVARPVQKQAQNVAKQLVGVASTARGGKAAAPKPAPAAAA